MRIVSQINGVSRHKKGGRGGRGREAGQEDSTHRVFREKFQFSGKRRFCGKRGEVRETSRGMIQEWLFLGEEKAGCSWCVSTRLEKDCYSRAKDARSRSYIRGKKIGKARGRRLWLRPYFACLFALCVAHVSYDHVLWFSKARICANVCECDVIWRHIWLYIYDPTPRAQPAQSRTRPNATSGKVGSRPAPNWLSRAKINFAKLERAQK